MVEKAKHPDEGAASSKEDDSGTDITSFLGKVIVLVWILFSAYSIRLHAVNVYGTARTMEPESFACRRAE